MIDLDELMRMHDAATPGPWKKMLPKVLVAEDPKNIYGIPLCIAIHDDNAQAAADAAYIVAACNAVPELVARIRELEEQLSAQSLKQVSALEPCRIVSNNNSTPPEWLMRRFTEVK